MAIVGFAGTITGDTHQHAVDDRRLRYGVGAVRRLVRERRRIGKAGVAARGEAALRDLLLAHPAGDDQITRTFAPREDFWYALGATRTTLQHQPFRDQVAILVLA